MADIQNGRCHDAKAPEKGPPFIQDGKIILQGELPEAQSSSILTPVRVSVSSRRETCVPESRLDRQILIFTSQIGWIVSGCFTILAVAISFWLIGKHLQWYTNVRSANLVLEVNHSWDAPLLQRTEQRCKLHVVWHHVLRDWSTSARHRADSSHGSTICSRELCFVSFLGMSNNLHRSIKCCCYWHDRFFRITRHLSFSFVIATKQRYSCRSSIFSSHICPLNRKSKRLSSVR